MDQYLHPGAAEMALTVRKVRVRITGVAEDVQRIADALEVALPGEMEWRSFAQRNFNDSLEVNGIGRQSPRYAR